MITRGKSPGSWRSGLLRWKVLRWLLAAVFLYAGAAKLLPEPTSFADSIASFHVLPDALVSPLALALPPFELLLGGALVLGHPRRLGAFGALTLGSVFLVALVSALVRGIPVECGCFGTGAGLLPLATTQRLWLDLARDGLIVAGALILYRHEAAVSCAAPDA